VTGKMICDGPVLGAMVSPVLFYAGAGAASIPILIHLLSKRRFRRIRWAAIDFLIEADRRNRRRVRLQELTLLALRCLAMLLAGAMLARLFVRPQALAAVLGSPAATERVIVLDDSFSMGLLHRAVETDSRHGTVFGRATSALERLVHWLREESPNDPLTILLASRPDQPLRTEVNVGRMDTDSLRDELETLEPSNRGGNMPEALAAVRRLLDARESSVNAAVYVVSDFQQADWIRGSRQEGKRGKGGEGETRRGRDEVGAPGEQEGQGRDFASSRSRGNGNPAAVLTGWADGNRTLRVVLVDVGIATTGNMCVTAIESRQSQVVAGLSASFAAKVTNFGDVESKQRSLEVYVGDAAQPPVTVPAVAPGHTIEVPFEIVFSHEGSEALTVELASDALPVDDTRAMAVPVTRALRVLVVNGEPDADPYQDEVFLLAVALRPEGPQFSGNQVSVVDEGEFEETELADFDVVVLANVFRVSEETAARLKEYVSAGGGLAVFLGDQVDADLYNRILYRNGEGLLPAGLREVVTVPAGQPGVPLGKPDLTHPVMRRFRDVEVAYFGGVVVRQYLTCAPAGAEEASTAPAGGAAIAPRGRADRDRDSRGPARVLLRLDDPDASPLIAERCLGRGRVWLVTTSVDKEWNNLADRPVFVVLAMEMVQYLARQTGRQAKHLAGEPIQFPLDPGRHRPVVTLKTPAYPDEPATRIDAQPDPSTGIPIVHWTRTDRPGIYQFELIEATGGEVVERAAVNVDPEESDLRRADRASLLESMPALAVEYVSGERLLSGQHAESRQELSSALLIALVVVLMSEQSLAWWFGSAR